VAAEGGTTVALDLDLTEDLRREGTAREVVRLVQDARKAAGLDVTDRISLSVQTEAEVAAAVDAHSRYVMEETLAADLSLDAAAADGAGHVAEGAVDGVPVRIRLSRATGDDRPGDGSKP